MTISFGRSMSLPLELVDLGLGVRLTCQRFLEAGFAVAGDDPRKRRTGASESVGPLLFRAHHVLIEDAPLVRLAVRSHDARRVEVVAERLAEDHPLLVLRQLRLVRR